MISPPLDVSVIVPAYNEEDNISKVLSELIRVKEVFPSMEIIVVDDGSSDRTSAEVAKFTSVKLIRHTKNRGKGAALKTGFKLAKGRVIVIQDADMEYSPHDIPNLIEPILIGAVDVVYGTRFTNKPIGMSSSHFLGNITLSKVASILYNKKITDIMTGYKAFSNKVLKEVVLKEDGFSVEVELTAQILSNGWKYQEVPISYSYRSHGISKISSLDGFSSLLRMFIFFIRS